ncbi:mucin-12-like [Acanthaster planci]|uniref:Mucin-12-like n=1 Tax=Acanthaster planci TaxID=133434 RepID=A0A8B7ZTD0_ACAPL|nr:mucin-12-like [Acanthaster planci]
MKSSQRTELADHKKVVEHSYKRAFCIFCNQDAEGGPECGKLLTDKDRQVYVHKYCLLFASGLSQSGADDEGIDGFLVPDILRELNRGRRLRCFYCSKKTATIGCSLSICKRGFHFNCGFKNEAMFCFFDSFLVFCKDHRPQQDVKTSKSDPATVTCPICFEDLEARVSNHVLKTPCCTNTWFHRTCVQQQALSAGYFFRCAICNNQEKFQLEMKNFGIYIPEHDASWEMEDNAFQELYWRHDRCDMDPCKCPQGRQFNKTSSKWELVLCDICGSSGCHLACGGLKHINQDWACAMCNAMMSNATEVSCPSAASPQKLPSSPADSPTKTGQTTRTAMKLMGKHPRTPLSSQTFRKKVTHSLFCSLKLPHSPEENTGRDFCCSVQGSPELAGWCDCCQPSTSKQGVEEGEEKHKKGKKRKKSSCGSKENKRYHSLHSPQNLGFKKHHTWKTQSSDLLSHKMSPSAGLKYGPRTTLRMSMRPRNITLLRCSTLNTPGETTTGQAIKQTPGNASDEICKTSKTRSLPTPSPAVTYQMENDFSKVSAEQDIRKEKVSEMDVAKDFSMLHHCYEESMSFSPGPIAENGSLNKNPTNNHTPSHCDTSQDANGSVTLTNSPTLAFTPSSDVVGQENRDPFSLRKKSPNASATCTHPVDEEPLSCLAARLASQAVKEALPEVPRSESGEGNTAILMSMLQECVKICEGGSDGEPSTGLPGTCTPPPSTLDCQRPELAEETAVSDTTRLAMSEALAECHFPESPGNLESSASVICLSSDMDCECAFPAKTENAAGTDEKYHLETDGPSEVLVSTDDKTTCPSPGSPECSANSPQMFDPSGPTSLPDPPRLCPSTAENTEELLIEGAISEDTCMLPPPASILLHYKEDNSTQCIVDLVEDESISTMSQASGELSEACVHESSPHLSPCGSKSEDIRELELHPEPLLQHKEVSISQYLQSMQRASTPTQKQDSVELSGEACSDSAQESNCKPFESSPSAFDQVVNGNATSQETGGAVCPADQPLGGQVAENLPTIKKRRKCSKDSLTYPVIGTGRFLTLYKKPKRKGNVPTFKKAVSSKVAQKRHKKSAVTNLATKNADSEREVTLPSGMRLRRRGKFTSKCTRLGPALETGAIPSQEIESVAGEPATSEGSSRGNLSDRDVIVNSTGCENGSFFLQSEAVAVAGNQTETKRYRNLLGSETCSAQDTCRNSKVKEARHSTGKLLRRKYLRDQIKNAQVSELGKGEAQLEMERLGSSVANEPDKGVAPERDPILKGATEANVTRDETISKPPAEETGGDLATEEPSSARVTSSTEPSPDSGISQDSSLKQEEPPPEEAVTMLMNTNELAFVNLTEEKQHCDTVDKDTQPCPLAQSQENSPSNTHAIDIDMSNHILSEESEDDSSMEVDASDDVLFISTSFSLSETNSGPSSPMNECPGTRSVSPMTSVSSSSQSSSEQDTVNPESGCPDTSATSQSPQSGVSDGPSSHPNPEVDLNHNPPQQTSIFNPMPGTPPVKPAPVKPLLTFSGRGRTNSPELCDTSGPRSCPGKYQSKGDTENFDEALRSLRTSYSLKIPSKVCANLFKLRKELSRPLKRPRTDIPTRPVSPLVSENDFPLATQNTTRIYASNSPKPEPSSTVDIDSPKADKDCISGSAVDEQCCEESPKMSDLQGSLTPTRDLPQRPWLLRSQTKRPPNSPSLESLPSIPSPSSGNSSTTDLGTLTGGMHSSTPQTRNNGSAGARYKTRIYMPNSPKVTPFRQSPRGKPPITPTELGAAGNYDMQPTNSDDGSRSGLDSSSS